MINKLKTTKHKEIMESMDRVISAYIELAFLDVSEVKTTKACLLPKNIRSIK